MCTAIFDDMLFGRTLDLEFSYGENVVITPKGYKFKYLYEKDIKNNSIIGIAHIQSGVPLYYDAMNENGLCMAGLNFPEYAKYLPYCEGKINLASFEVIPYVLRNCDSVKEAIKVLEKVNITNDSFSSELKTTPLHFMVADKNESIVIEPRECGLNIHKNPFGVMTNSPDFEFQRVNLSNYMGLDSKTHLNTICKDTDIEVYSRGLGGFGLPGDFSSTSRFVRAVFVKNHTVKDNDKIGRFFHILDSVSVPKGCIITDTGEAVYTVYTSCMDMDKKEFYYRVYEGMGVRKVELKKFELGGSELIRS